MLNTLGVFVDSEQKDNLLDGTSATVHTDTTQRMSVQSKAASDEKAEKDTKRILIVEDEEGIVKLVKMYLEHHRYEVITANDGQEGLGKAKTEKPDLIVLDLMLPKMDGYKVCGLLKKDTRYAKIPVILFTAKAQEKDVKLGQEVGADAYITKPFEPEVLLSKIEELIKE
jgi:DNA-binding response OmpR family regulator